MKSRLSTILGAVLSLALFSAALWVLHRELHAFHLAEISKNVRSLSGARLGWALLLTALGYSVMTGYDYLALKYVKQSQPFHRVALASFAAYAFSNNIGLSMLAGASIRYRLYSAWDVSTLDITKVIAFCTLSVWLGFLADAGLVFIFEPLSLPAGFHLPFQSTRPLGVLFLLLTAAYFLAGALVKKTLRLKQWTFEFPSAGLFAPQMAVAMFDWILAGSVLWVLLPPTEGLNFVGFLGLFLLAQLAGFASQVPGGLGVFETVALILLTPHYPAPTIAGVLVVFRVVYYLTPLVIAAVLVAGQEVLQARGRLIRAGGLAGRTLGAVMPQLMGATTFLGGIILLASGATPAQTWRLHWLYHFLPLPVIETSHFLGSVAGAVLLVLAVGLIRRIDFAYVLSAILLGVGTAASLLKGLDYEEAAILTVILVALLPSRRYFRRRASILHLRFTPLWAALVILVLVCVAWLTFFAYKHVEYSHSLWWRFVLLGDAPRSLRALVGSVGVVLVFGLARLMSPARPAPSGPASEDWARIGAVIERSPNSSANLAWLGDKSFLFSPSGRSFIMYGLSGRSWVAMGGPVGEPDEWADLVWDFHEMCDRHGGWTVFYEVGSSDLSLYLDLGLSLLKIGEEARVPLAEFSLQGGSRKGLRYTISRTEKDGARFELLPPERVGQVMPDLRRISDAWLAEKQTREKGFSLGFFDEAYLARFPAAIVRGEDGQIHAFANLWPSADRRELSIDLMRHLPDAPAGVMEYLFLKLMLWGKDEGYQWFNLGMAPLSGLESRALSPLWVRLESLLYRHGEHFFNFQGLRRYKDKFDPVWTPKYIASPGGLALPVIFMNLAALTAGGLKGAVAK